MFKVVIVIAIAIMSALATFTATDTIRTRFQLVSAIARKTALASAGLVFYYVSRYLKVGAIDWDEEWRKKIQQNRPFT